MVIDWQTAAKQKREGILAAIPKEWRLDNVPSAQEQRDVTGKYIQQYLSDKEIELTETDAVGILEKTTTGQWSAVDVTSAFCHRAALAHQLVSCLHEAFFDTAISDAKKLDEYFARHKKPIGSLHGLPVSLKDQFHIKGVDTCMGYVGWIGTFQGKDKKDKTEYESVIVQALRKMGAVLYCKTSVPHTLMCGETVNNIIGYTWNPKNRNLTCGGSSGGEGALISLKGSPVGFGTDIGGSIRIPAAFNGVFGIRPSSGRIPYEGMANSMDGQNTVLSVVGPLATSMRSLRMISKALLSQEPWLHDPLVVEMPWRDEQERLVQDIIGSAKMSGKLSFGVLKNDGVVVPTPPIRRAMDMVVQTIQKLGHEVIEWKPTVSHDKLVASIAKTWVYDGGADVRKAFSLSGEPMAPQVHSVYGEARPEFSASDIAATNVEKREQQKEYMEYWNSTVNQTSTGRPVDAVISPLAAFPAARPEKYIYYGYSMYVNQLDYTSVVVPVTSVDKNVDKEDDGYKPLNDTDKEVHEAYDPDIFDGAHVSLQLIGRRLQEEKMLAIGEFVSNALKA